MNRECNYDRDNQQASPHRHGWARLGKSWQHGWTTTDYAVRRIVGALGLPSNEQTLDAAYTLLVALVENGVLRAKSAVDDKGEEQLVRVTLKKIDDQAPGQEDEQALSEVEDEP